MQLVALIFTLLLSTAYSLKAQTDTPQFTIRWFNTENGLPANGIKGIQWDAETELAWIATEAGVARFNGTEFNLYTRTNNPILASERINFIVKNNKGKIFLCENVGNAIKIDENKLAPYNIVKNKNIKNDNTLYGLNVSENYFRHLLTTENNKEFFLPFDKVAAIDDNSAMIVSYYKVYINDVRQKEIIEYDFNNKKAKNIFKIGDNLYLLDKNNKIYSATVKTQRSTPVNIELEGIGPKTQLPTQAELIWENGQTFPIVIYGNIAWKLIEVNKKLKGIKICSQVPIDALIKNFLYVEEKGLIIIGTDSKGIAVLQKNSVTPVRNKNPSNLASNSYYSQIELADGSILTGESHRLGLSIKKNAELPIKDKFANSVYLTADSLLWYQQFTIEKNRVGIFSYNPSTKKRTFEHAINQGNSFAVWNQQDTTLIFSAENIIQIKPSKKTLLAFPIEQITKSDPITSLVIDKNRIALATCNGLVFYNKFSNTTDTILSLRNYCIRSLARYDDYILIGTYGDGIYIHKLNEKTIKIPIDKKRSGLYAHCFVTDSLNYVWISTNRGLLKANINDLIAAYHSPKREIYYRYFGIADGMITSEMNGGCHPCALQLKNGYISFPTMDGLLWVDPKKTISDTQRGALLIDEIRVNDKLIESPSKILYDLPFSTKQISIKLSYAAWSNRENIYIYYRLRPTDPWKEVSYSNPSLIEINNIEPGEYELQIRKLNGFGADNNSLLTVPFYIKTPWYNKWWFYGSCALALYGMIILYLSIRTRQLQRSEKKLKALVEEKTIELTTQNQTLEKNNLITSRLISIISHDIVTPLKFIQVAGKNLLNKKEKLPEDLKQETLTEITNTAQELQNLSTNILNWIRFQRKNRLLQRVNFSPYEVGEQVIRILRPSAKIKNLRLQNNIEATLIIHQYAEPFRILLHNLLSNAINFSEKGIIAISVIEQADRLQLKVTDQGVGMTSDQIENILNEDLIISSATVDNRKGHGLGYQIIKDLSGLIEATLEIESQKGKGTTILINFNKTA
jgi:signal transduction histidine kinase